MIGLQHNEYESFVGLVDLQLVERAYERGRAVWGYAPTTLGRLRRLVKGINVHGQKNRYWPMD